MDLEDLKRRAVERSKPLPEPQDALESLRHASMAFFSKVPEPPLYRRRDDPVKAQAAELLPEAEALLVQAYSVTSIPDAAVWRNALELHARVVCLLEEGRIEAAGRAWTEALAAERVATSARRLWVRSDEAPIAVFDSKTRVSRFDPHAETSMQVTLACPSCRKLASFSASTRHGTHQFVCLHCSAEFIAYFAEVRSLTHQPLPRGRRYHFRLEELGGAQTRIDVDDVGKDELPVAPRDVVAFLYMPRPKLRGVLNLSSSRVLWVDSGSQCFIASAVFRDDAPQVTVLRRFRDEVLMRSSLGRVFVKSYYRASPPVARWLMDREWARNVLKPVFEIIVRGVSRG